MSPDPYYCTGFLLVAFTAVGVIQTVWLRSPISRRLAWPIDGGRMWRGRRIFGDNKTWAGFIVMVPVTGIAFGLLAAGLREFHFVSLDRLWKISVFQYTLLGAWAGLGFMLGELPNSFIKRRFGVEPGQMPRNRLVRIFTFVLDQADSVLGALLALECAVRVPWLTWAILLTAGPFVHWLFNVVLWLLGFKRRAA